MGFLPAGVKRWQLLCLRQEAAADHAGNAYQTGSEKTRCAGLSNLRSRVAARDGKASAGAAVITHDADGESEAGNLTNVGIQNGEAQGCGEMFLRQNSSRPA